MQGLKDYLIRSLGGFTLHEMQHKDTELENVKKIRVEERSALEREILNLMRVPDPENVPIVHESSSVVQDAISLAPLPWSRLRRQLEKEDARKAKNEETQNAGR